MKQRTWVYGVVLVAAGSAGCSLLGNDKQAGTLVVPFQLGNQKDCASLGVVTVRAELDTGDVSKEVNCAAGKIRLDGVKAGSHKVVLYGLDKDDLVIMDSLGAQPLSIKVEDGKTALADPPVELSLAPVKLLLRWDFGFASCDGASIASFQVSAWRSDGAQRLLKTEVKCNTPGKGAGQYRDVPDSARDLSGDELGELEIQPVTSTAAAVGAPVKFTFAPPGPGREIKLSLTCDANGCTGSGSPD